VEVQRYEQSILPSPIRARVGLFLCRTNPRTPGIINSSGLADSNCLVVVRQPCGNLLFRFSNLRGYNTLFESFASNTPHGFEGMGALKKIQLA
jgi:hypothetical protein